MTPPSPASPATQGIRMSGIDPKLTDSVRRVRDGDMAAARELVESVSPLVRRIVCSHLPWRMSSEDLTQEVFMKLFAKLDQYAGVVPFEHWVARVAMNTCRDQLRSQKRDPEIRWTDLGEEETRALEAVAADEAVPESGAVSGARELAGRLMATLGPEDRLVIQMIDLEQRSAAEVKAVTGWSVTSIRVRAFRARRKLRKRVEKMEREPRT
jgi:RNA polymerase sigma-70 factor, ECF subfamily